jgi:hypothetical protein
MPLARVEQLLSRLRQREARIVLHSGEALGARLLAFEVPEVSRVIRETPAPSLSVLDAACRGLSVVDVSRLAFVVADVARRPTVRTEPLAAADQRLFLSGIRSAARWGSDEQNQSRNS